MIIDWQLKSFGNLSPFELYEILRLRTEVFVVEQSCVFQDMDNKDHDSHHLMGRIDGVLVAYTRLLPAGLAYTHPSIGRVVTSPSARGKGLGRLLMDKSIEETVKLYGETTIVIGAQLYLQEFYNSFGFEKSSDIYDEDGIDHIQMTR